MEAASNHLSSIVVKWPTDQRCDQSEKTLAEVATMT